MRLLPNINAKRIKLNSRLSKRLKGLEKKKRGKSNVCESSKKRQLTDRLKSMLFELRERSRRAKDKPEKEKSLNRPRGKESKLTSKRLDKSNSLKRHLPSQNRLV